MKFSEYIKQLNGYAPNNIVSINYKNKSFLYKNEANCDDYADHEDHAEHVDYDNLNVTGDGFIKIKEYLDWNVVGVEVFLSDNDEKSNPICFVLEILKMKHMAELKSKQKELESIRKFNEYLEEREKELNQKAQQELEEYNEWWSKHEKEQAITAIAFIVASLVVLFLSLWLSR